MAPSNHCPTAKLLSMKSNSHTLPSTVTPITRYLMIEMREV